MSIWSVCLNLQVSPEHVNIRVSHQTKQYSSYIASHKIQTTTHAMKRKDKKKPKLLAYCLFHRLCDTRVGETLLRLTILDPGSESVWIGFKQCLIHPWIRFIGQLPPEASPKFRLLEYRLAVRHLWRFSMLDVLWRRINAHIRPCVSWVSSDSSPYTPYLLFIAFSVL
jgi:hypothetical protein